MKLFEERKKFVKKHYLENRTTVSNATNKVNEEVAEILKGKLLKIPSRTECFTWIIPDQWEVKEAYVKDLDSGKKIIDFKDNPLHLWSASESFKGTLTFNELKDHLLFRKEAPTGIPYHYGLQYNYTATGWGFSLSYNQFKKLNKKAKYKIVIDTESKKGLMTIADCSIPGKSKKTIYLGAHSCHPGIVNDGLLCVTMLIDFFKYIQQQGKPYYTYRLIVGPEYFAGAGFLHKAKGIENIKMGLYLDMIANNQRVAFSKSWNGASQMDKAVELAIKSTVDEHKLWDYRRLWGNDELFYDGPDFLIPTTVLGRDYYGDFTKEYHTSIDDYKFVNWDQYFEIFEILKKSFHYLENNRIPERCYKGPLYMSRYSINPAKYSNQLQDAQILMDKKNTLIDISSETDIPFEFLDKIVEEMEKNNLVKSKKP